MQAQNSVCICVCVCLCCVHEEMMDGACKTLLVSLLADFHCDEAASRNREEKYVAIVSTVVETSSLRGLFDRPRALVPSQRPFAIPARANCSGSDVALQSSAVPLPDPEREIEPALKLLGPIQHKRGALECLAVGVRCAHCCAPCPKASQVRADQRDPRASY